VRDNQKNIREDIARDFELDTELDIELDSAKDIEKDRSQVLARDSEKDTSKGLAKDIERDSPKDIHKDTAKGLSIGSPRPGSGREECTLSEGNPSDALICGIWPVSDRESQQTLYDTETGGVGTGQRH
jgi:hypothetical protein